MNGRTLGMLVFAVCLAGCSVPLMKTSSVGLATLKVGGVSVPRTILTSTVTYALEGQGPNGAALEKTTFGPEGTVVTDLLPGHWTFQVSALDDADVVLQSGRAEVDLVAGQENPVTFTMHSRGAVSGRIVDEAGDPVAGAVLWVAVVVDDKAKVVLKDQSTDAAGKFVFEDLPRGDLHIVVMDAPARVLPNTGSWWKPAVVTADLLDEQILDDSAPVEAVASGKIGAPFTNNPQAGAETKLVSSPLSGPVIVERAWSTLTDANYYLFSTVASDANLGYRVVATLDNCESVSVYLRYYQGSWERNNDGWNPFAGVLNLTLKAPRIYLQTLQEDNFTAAPGVPYTLSGPSGTSSGLSNASGVIDTWGENLALGTYTITFPAQYQSYYPNQTIELTLPGQSQVSGLGASQAGLTYWSGTTGNWVDVDITPTFTLQKSGSVTAVDDVTMFLDATTGAYAATFPAGTWDVFVDTHGSTHHLDDAYINVPFSAGPDTTTTITLSGGA